MGNSSKRIAIERIIESLFGFLKAGYNSLVNGLKKLSKDQKFFISKEQNKEIIILCMFAILRAISTACGDNIVSKNITEKFQQKIFKNYFKDTKERENFKELFLKRYNEYSELLSPENLDLKNLDLHIGQIFCKYFWGEDDESLAITMMFAGYICISVMTETKKFLDEVVSKYIIVF